MMRFHKTMCLAIRITAGSSVCALPVVAQQQTDQVRAQTEQTIQRGGQKTALSLTREGTWLRLSEGIEARLIVERPEIAADQAWQSTIVLRNTSGEAVSLGGNMELVFAPVLRDKATGRSIPPVRVRDSEQTFFVPLDQGQTQNIASSAPAWHPGDLPASVRYRYGGQDWNVGPGEYTLGGTVQLAVMKTGVVSPLPLRGVLPPVTVRIWKPQTNDQMLQQRSAVNRRYAEKPEQKWAALVALVRPGMRRDQVQTLLFGNAQNASAFQTDYMGGGQAQSYQVDAHWSAVVSYDYTGTPPRTHNGTRLDSPENRVTSLPKLLRHEQPVMDLQIKPFGEKALLR